MFGCVALGAAVSISAPAYAANDAMMDLLKILRDKGSISADEYDLLKAASAADKEKVEGVANELKGELSKKTKGLPNFKNLDKGKLKITSANGENTFQLGGRVMADTTFGLGDTTLGSEGDNVVTEFRRARMFIGGKFQKYWKYKFQYDFAGQSAGATSAASTSGIRDAYIAYTGFKPVTVTLGHHKMPLSLEELTSSKYITFIERSQLVNGIVADTGGGRQYGLSVKGYFGDMFTAAGAFHAGTANEDTADTQSGFTGRLTFSPIHEKTKMVHLGIGYDRSKQQGGGFNIDGEPEVHPGRDILENEGVDHRTSNTFVLEAAGIYGPFAIQAEYASNELSDSTSNLPDIDADAWYIYGSYYLTGESRNYKWKKGSYSQTKVKNPLHKGGLGAWEVALRYTSGDFENATNPIVSSDADILTLGLNWYPSNNTRFSANYVTVLDANAAADAELAADVSTGRADDAEYLVVRGQWYF